MVVALGRRHQLGKEKLMSMGIEEWPTTWQEIRLRGDEYRRLDELLYAIQEAAYRDEEYVISVDDGVWLAGLFHWYFAEGHFQGDEWKERLLAEGHTVNS